MSVTDRAPCPSTNNQNAENNVIDDAFSPAKTDANLPETLAETVSQSIVESECPEKSTSTTQLRRSTRVRPNDMKHEFNRPSFVLFCYAWYPQYNYRYYEDDMCVGP